LKTKKKKAKNGYNIGNVTSPNISQLSKQKETMKNNKPYKYNKHENINSLRIVSMIPGNLKRSPDECFHILTPRYGFFGNNAGFPILSIIYKFSKRLL